MSLSPIGSAVFELLSRKHTYRQTDIHHITLEYRYNIYNVVLFFHHTQAEGDSAFAPKVKSHTYMNSTVFCTHRNKMVI